MNLYKEKLLQNDLFKNLASLDLERIRNCNASFMQYKKNSVVIQEGDICKSVGFVIEGAISMQQLSMSGDITTVYLLKPNDCFGTSPIFLPDPKHTFTLISTMKTIVIYIPYDEIIKLIYASPLFSLNYIILLSNQLYMFNTKIRLLSQKSVRGKICLYFDVLFRKNNNLTFKLPHTKTEIAYLIGVARPSLSREFKRMQQDRLIEVNDDIIKILNQEILSL